MEKNFEFTQALTSVLSREENELPKHFDALRDVCFYLPFAMGKSVDELNLNDEIVEVEEIEKRIKKVISDIRKKQVGIMLK